MSKFVASLLVQTTKRPKLMLMMRLMIVRKMAWSSSPFSSSGWCLPRGSQIQSAYTCGTKSLFADFLQANLSKFEIVANKIISFDQDQFKSGDFSI